VRSEVELPPVCVADPAGVPPTAGVAVGRGVGRSVRMPGLSAPGPGAAGVPGVMVTPASLPALDGGDDVVARSRAARAAAVYPPGGVDVDPEPGLPAVGAMLGDDPP